MTDLEKKRNWFQRLFAVRGMGQVITVFFGLIALCAVFYLINPNFLFSVLTASNPGMPWHRSIHNCHLPAPGRECPRSHPRWHLH